MKNDESQEIKPKQNILRIGGDGDGRRGVEIGGVGESPTKINTSLHKFQQHFPFSSQLTPFVWLGQADLNYIVPIRCAAVPWLNINPHVLFISLHVTSISC